MQEAARTKTDARGKFRLQVPDPGLHLVRVTHDKANYFRPAPPGTQSVDIDVYNAAAKVVGISEEADVVRLQTDEGGKTLQIVENFFIKNESSPPKTQFSDRPFEFYLPAGAVVVGSAALSPGGMPVQTSPVPLEDANHYAFVFPVRPGETRFQISYTVPYSGSFQMAPKLVMPTDTVAVMMPKSMIFKGVPGSPYSPISDEVNVQTLIARGVTAAQPLGFAVSGTGQLPRDTGTATGTAAGAATGAATPGQQAQPAAADNSASTAAPGSAATDTRPGGGLGTPIDPNGTNDPWAKYKWWILGGLGLLFAAGAGLMLQSGSGKPLASSAPATASAAWPPAQPGTHKDALLLTLKEELFAVETDRLQGRLKEPAYSEQKQAIEVVMRRALSREEPQTSDSAVSSAPDPAPGLRQKPVLRDKA